MSYQILTSLSAIKEISDSMIEKKYVGLDSETTGLSAISNRLRLIQFSAGDECYVIDCFDFNLPDLADALREFFTNTSCIKIGHNLKFDYQFILQHLGIKLQGIYCSMVADNVLDFRRQKGWHGLESNAYKYLGLKMDKAMQKSDWSLPRLSERQLEYAANDVKLLPALREAQVKQIIATRQVEPLKLELGVLPVVAEIELKGFRLDLDTHNALIDRLKIERDDKEKALNAFLDEKLQIDKTFTFNVFTDEAVEVANASTVNIRSATQLLKAFQKMDFPIDTTNADDLEPLLPKYPDLKLLLDFRNVEKTISTYGEKLQSFINPNTGRIHCNIRQIGADTRRTAFSSPNLTNQPSDNWFRECYKPEKGYLYQIADYSAIEMRIAADLSNDKVMLQAFEDGIDMHSLTASKVFDIPLEYLDKTHPDFKKYKEKRQIAKTLNFGIIYGLAGLGLQAKLALEGIIVSEKEAQEMIDAFYRTYPDLRKWLYDQESLVVKNRCLRTPAGYLINFSADWKDFRQVNSIKRKARNFPIQNLSCAITKNGILLIHNSINDLGIKNCGIVNVIHDEILVEHLPEDEKVVKELVEKAFIDSQKRYLKRVKVIASSDTANSWAEKG
jgi:DNA polymerase I-like protein with 3'-5' exonuclease and polymerase domains